MPGPSQRPARRVHPHRQRGPDQRPGAAPEPDPPAGQLRCDPVSRGHPGRGARPGHPGVCVGGSGVRPGPGLYSAQAWDGRVRDSGTSAGRAGEAQPASRAAGLGGRAGRSLGRPASRGRPWGGPGGGGAGSPGGPGLPPQGPGGAGASPPGGMPGSPSGGPPGRRPEGSRVFNRNTLGIAAAIALVAGYLGVAAVAHLSPFPADTVAATSSQSPSTGPSTGTAQRRARGRARARVRTGHRMRPPTRARRRTTRSC